MKKSHLKKKSLKSKLTWLSITITLFLVGSVYAAFSFGSGPLTGLLQSASINRVVVEDPNFAKTSAERKAINELNNAANQEFRAVTNKQKAAAESRLEKAWNDLAKIEKAQAPANLNTTAGDAQSPSPPAVTPPVASTPPTVNQQSKPDSCEGGNGVKLTPGKYAATGYGWKDGKRSTESETSQRECVYIDDNCGHSTVVACDEQYLKDPSSVILPVSAGSEYYAGKTPAQIKEDEKNNIPLPSKPQENCYDKSGTIHVTGDTNGENRCFNGSFLPENEFDKKMGATCDQSTQEYNAGSNKCEAKANPFTLVPLPPIDHVKAKQQCEAANNKDTNKANDKAYNSKNGTCNLVSAPVPTCKAGWNSTNTGYTECEGGKTHYLVCDKNTSSIVNGSCVSNAYPNVDKECGMFTASRDSNGAFIGTPSCSQLCGGLGSYPKDGKQYCNTTAASTAPVTSDPAKITNPDGIVGAYANDRGECKYGNGAIEELNGKFSCPTETLANPILDNNIGNSAQQPESSEQSNKKWCTSDGDCGSGSCDRSGFWVWTWGCGPSTSVDNSPSPVTQQEAGRRVLDKNQCSNGAISIGGIYVCNNSDGTPFDLNQPVINNSEANQPQPVASTQISHAVGGASAGVGLCGAVSILAAPFTGFMSIPAGVLVCGGAGLVGGLIGYNIP